MSVKELLVEGEISAAGKKGKVFRYRVHPVPRQQDPEENFEEPQTCWQHDIGGEYANDLRDKAHHVREKGATGAPKPKETINEKRANSDETERAVHLIMQLLQWGDRHSKAQIVRKALFDWADQGFDLEQDILPGIAHAISERPGKTSKLERFNSTISAFSHRRRRGEIISVSRERSPGKLGSHEGAAKLEDVLQRVWAQMEFGPH